MRKGVCAEIRRWVGDGSGMAPAVAEKEVNFQRRRKQQQFHMTLEDCAPYPGERPRRGTTRGLEG